MPEFHDARRRVPEARIPAFVLRSPDFAKLVMKSAVATHVWLLLASYARKDVAWCSQRRLAAQIGCHRRTLVEALDLLVKMGWLTKAKRFDPKSPRERLADEFRLRLPGPLDEVRTKLNLRLAGKPVEGEIPYVREDDVFQYASETFTRMARVPQDTLASVEFEQLRRSGRALHLYLLICVYAPSGERVPASRLAEEASTTVARVREAMAILTGAPSAPPSAPSPYMVFARPYIEALREANPEMAMNDARKAAGVEWRRRKKTEAPKAKRRKGEAPVNTTAKRYASAWIEVTCSKRADKSNRPNSYTVVQRLLTPAMAPVLKETGVDVVAAEAAAASAGEVFGTGAPPEDLVAKLPGDLRRMMDDAYPDRDDPERWGSLWAMIRDEGYWPRPKVQTPQEGATDLIRQFHGMMRKVDASAYSPTANELTFVLDLFRDHGADTWAICQYAVKQLQKSRHPAGNAAAMRPYIGEAVASLAAGAA